MEGTGEEISLHDNLGNLARSKIRYQFPAEEQPLKSLCGRTWRRKHWEKSSTEDSNGTSPFSHINCGVKTGNNFEVNSLRRSPISYLLDIRWIALSSAWKPGTRTPLQKIIRSLMLQWACFIAYEFPLYFFHSLGYPCPINFNPADHFVHTLAIVPGNEQNCQQRVQVRHAVVSSLNGGNSPF